MTPLEELVDDAFYIVMNANDFFNYACAESVSIDIVDLPWILPIVEKYGINAVMSFVYKQLPLEPYITEGFKEAHQAILDLNLETVWSFEANDVE